MAEQPKTVRRITVEIEGIEGVEKATLELQSGALNVLQGRNGIGKTSAARAIARALGAKVDGLEMREGETLGTVHVSEGETAVSLVVPASGRVRTKGDAPITSGDTAALTRLITGDNCVGAAARNAARIEAFLQIVRPAVDAEAVAVLTERDAEMGAWLAERLAAGSIPSDLLSAAERLKEELQRRAREDHEKLADTLAGEEQANERRGVDLRAELALLGFAGQTNDDWPAAESEVERLAAEADSLKRSAEERARQEADREAIRAAGAPRPDVNEAYAKVKRHLDKRNEARANAERLALEIERLQAEHAAATRLAADHLVEGKQAEDVWRGIEEQAKRWDAQQALLLAPVEGATPAEVEAAEHRLQAARRKRDAARLSVAIDEAQDAAARAKSSREKLAARGKQLRDWSISIRERVADLLAKSGAEGFGVADGALTYQGQDFDDRLSAGQKVSAAIGLAARFWSGFVFVDPDYYARLDVEHRGELDAFCASRPDLIIVTEEPTAGELVVAHGAGGAA